MARQGNALSQGIIECRQDGSLHHFAIGILGLFYLDRGQDSRMSKSFGFRQCGFLLLVRALFLSGLELRLEARLVPGLCGR